MINVNKVISVRPCVPTPGEAAAIAGRFVPRRRVLSDFHSPSEEAEDMLLGLLFPMKDAGIRTSFGLGTVRLAAASAAIIFGIMLSVGSAWTAAINGHTLLGILIVCSGGLIGIGTFTRPQAVILTVLLTLFTTVAGSLGASVSGCGALLCAVLAIFGPGKWSLDYLLYLALRHRG